MLPATALPDFSKQPYRHELRQVALMQASRFRERKQAVDTESSEHLSATKGDRGNRCATRLTDLLRAAISVVWS